MTSSHVEKKQQKELGEDGGDSFTSFWDNRGLMMYSSKSSNTSVTAVTDTNVAVPLHTTGAAKSNLANSSNKSKKFLRASKCVCAVTSPEFKHLQRNSRQIGWHRMLAGRQWKRRGGVRLTSWQQDAERVQWGYCWWDRNALWWRQWSASILASTHGSMKVATSAHGNTGACNVNVSLTGTTLNHVSKAQTDRQVDRQFEQKHFS